ncbi:hypothetical protein SYNPS1DRAFT_25567 [Syncephalis pseudoplumigaleata]|uniref:Protein kinase domain-containing protein n=1 Tax=Syncephalis pseudoplumigaleata TaxID=1712513 RepID=A0A4P9YRV9_9FUNG|nr:hypothetical protein SYNPS1DRAFT_25567 [Syncephalis pseudoplumigaleata]|eukprot:RKP22626.1 hypothetical protein SYNPS1DRAFT_25567 [Syncephalis pseudoplumigaleata]
MLGKRQRDTALWHCEQQDARGKPREVIVIEDTPSPAPSVAAAAAAVGGPVHGQYYYYPRWLSSQFYRQAPGQPSPLSPQRATLSAQAQRTPPLVRSAEYTPVMSSQEQPPLTPQEPWRHWSGRRHPPAPIDLPASTATTTLPVMPLSAGLVPSSSTFADPAMATMPLSVRQQQHLPDEPRTSGIYLPMAAPYTPLGPATAHNIALPYTTPTTSTSTAAAHLRHAAIHPPTLLPTRPMIPHVHADGSMPTTPKLPHADPFNAPALSTRAPISHPSTSLASAAMMSLAYAQAMLPATVTSTSSSALMAQLGYAVIPVTETAALPPCDDKEGHYIVTPNENLTPRYKIMRLLGQGTFGKVAQCWDRQTRQYCAIKIIRAVQKYRDASRIEIRVLRELQRWDPKNQK